MQQQESMDKLSKAVVRWCWSNIRRAEGMEQRTHFYKLANRWSRRLQRWERIALGGTVTRYGS